MKGLGRIPLGVFVAVLMFALGGCATDQSAPVVDGTDPGKRDAGSLRSSDSAANAWAAAKLRHARPDTHVVQKGDTLYNIAMQYGLDYRELAHLNALADTNLIRIGQVLKLRENPQGNRSASASGDSTVETTPFKADSVISTDAPSAAAMITQPKAIKLPYSAAALEQLEKGADAPEKPEATSPSAAAPAPVTPGPQTIEKETGDMSRGWIWPTQGRILAGFNEANNRKGLDISGKSGQAIQAARSGKVVYSGSGLRGYGKLVIIKHNPMYLSAYAHNRRVLVKEGQMVARGQKIAEMGDSDADQVKLHFEIRQMGKPVDPMEYLH